MRVHAVVQKLSQMLAASPSLDGLVLRPQGWTAVSDAAYDVLAGLDADKGSRYRGMTSAEYDNTVAKGLGVVSRGDYSLSVEGTQFGDASDAESYVNYGRTDPRKTGKPNYFVQVRSQGLKRKPDGYYEPIEGRGLPQSDILGVWEMRDEDGAIVAHKIPVPR